MALRQRPAARFFAAFYRWSCYTQQTSCTHPARYRQAGVYRHPNVHSTRSYFATSWYHQDERGQQQQMDWVEDEVPADYTLAQVGTAALSDAVRGLMRHVPASVAIITAAHVDPESNKAVPLGIVVSSFNTVTLDPPHVSFNIKCPSKTLDAIRDAKGLFRVHLLSCKEKSGQIVDMFTRGNTPESYLLRQRSVPMFLPPSRHHIDATDSVAPQIRGPTVVAALECELTQEVPVADHVIAVAKVNSLATKSELEATLLYHDGAYKRTNGTVLHQRRTASKSNTKLNSEVGRYWKYPLFPGEAERTDLVDYLKAYIQWHPHLLEMNTSRAGKELQQTLGVPSGVLGISLWRLIDQCRINSGVLSGLEMNARSGPLLSDFYGRLTPGNIAAILERARKLVLANPMSLALHYKIFLSHLGVALVNYGLLASDILERLRAEGLVAPFEQQPRVDDPSFQPTIESLENVEFRLRNFMKKYTYQEVYKMTSEELQQGIKESDWVVPYIRRVRIRLTVETFPDVFNVPHIDIKGELTPEEVRVLINRVVQFLSVENSQVMRRRISLPKVELLRRIGVHPLVSGVDPEFLFGKLSFLASQSNSYHEFPRAVDEMLKPIFEKQVFTWAELESRVRVFVQRNTLHAVKWSREDILAAMGIDHHAKIRTPLSENRPHILHGHILPILIAKELRNHYGNGTPEENAVIKAFLKSKYNYEVVAPSSAPSEERGSAEEMHEAMQRGLNVHVLNKDRAKMELEEAMKAFGRKKDGGRKFVGTGAARKGKSIGSRDSQAWRAVRVD